MRLIIRFPLRHPLHPDWTVTPARTARGSCFSLSGTFRELMKAAREGVSAQRAVFAMQFPDNPFLSDSDRDALWEAFQVPVFACLLDGEGRLVGYECEAQDGLHVPMMCPTDSNRMMISQDDSVLGYRLPLDQAVVDASPCECGRPGQRLRFAGPRAPRRLGVVRVP